MYDTASGRYVVIPQGTKLFGRYDAYMALGQERLLIVWNRLVFPDGETLDIGGMQGYDSRGLSGFTDRVDTHFLRTLGERAPDQCRQRLGGSAGERSLRAGQLDVHAEPRAGLLRYDEPARSTSTCGTGCASSPRSRSARAIASTSSCRRTSISTAPTSAASRPIASGSSDDRHHGAHDHVESSPNPAIPAGCADDPRDPAARRVCRHRAAEGVLPLTRPGSSPVTSSRRSRSCAVSRRETPRCSCVPWVPISASSSRASFGAQASACRRCRKTIRDRCS